MAAIICSMLAACTGGKKDEPNGPLISLYNARSELIYAGFNPLGTPGALLPTFHHQNYGDVPYVNLEDFAKAVSSVNATLLSPTTRVEKIADHLFSISSYGVPAMYFDAENDVVTVKRDDFLHLESYPLNNGVGNDVCTPSDDNDSCVQTSKKSKYINSPTDAIYELKDYNIDLVDQNDKLYLPQPFASGMLLKDVPTDIMYNGLDYYVSALIGEGKEVIVGANASFYSNKKSFTFGGQIFTEYPAVGNEHYRFIYNDGTKYSIFAFLDDGNVELYHTTDPSGTSAPVDDSMTFAYYEQDNGLFVTAMLTMGELPPQSLGTFKIPFEETNFNTKKRSPEVARFTYDYLRFIFDDLYGLPDELHKHYNVKNVEELVVAKGIKEDLLSTDSMTYDHALATLTMTYVDDCHTKYLEPSVYSGFVQKGSEINQQHVGERRAALGNYLSNYQKLRTDTMTAINPKYSDTKLQQGLFMEGSTAVVRFDGFNAQSTFISRSAPIDLDPEKIPDLLQTSSPNGFYSAFKEIEKHNEIKNVVIDLTANGGGVAATLPYLAAFFTDDPTFFLRNSRTDTIEEFHYKVDLNRNGVFNEPEDTYKGRYNIFLLTSNFSFSCGNALPTMARTAGVTIIGQQSGGGACTVKNYSDGCGSSFNTSNQNQIVYKDPDGNFINNDQGIPVDYELASDSWYDLTKLNAFVNSIIN